MIDVFKMKNTSPMHKIPNVFSVLFLFPSWLWFRFFYCHLFKLITTDKSESSFSLSLSRGSVPSGDNLMHLQLVCQLASEPYLCLHVWLRHRYLRQCHAEIWAIIIITGVLRVQLRVPLALGFILTQGRQFNASSTVNHSCFFTFFIGTYWGYYLHISMTSHT